LNTHANAIANRLSLRQPQRDSLDILAHVCDLIPLDKSGELETTLKAVQSAFPTVTDFERDFPSLCFALATGVGKTRLMGAFISYLVRAEGIRHFFVLSPNLTIYNKLIADFTPNTPKYVFQGIAEFATHPPIIITGDNYTSGVGVRQGGLFETDEVHVNIFNISKINSEVRGGKSPRIKRLSEYIGESYFEYLSKLDDLVLLMDESHRYRASAGIRAINELKPILGLELTATPQVESGAKSVPFKNVIYSYPLSNALTDGFVKEPAVATRENFQASNYDKEGLERLKLEDGIHIHEHTKVELEVYARETGRELVKPFMLVVAQDTEHANALMKVIEDESFFEGRYKGKVVTVHSNQRGEEKDETVQQLLSVEDKKNPVEIVIHVNMLKEGWDVTNLYTIVPLRAANSRTLVEQSIGRGLRLPYGKRVGVAAVDRLTIVSHDKFHEIVEAANDPNSIIRTGVVIGRDIPTERVRLVEVSSNIETRILGANGESGGVQTGLFEKPGERLAAKATLRAIQEMERLPRVKDLTTDEVQQELVRRIEQDITPAQYEIKGVGEKPDFAAVVKETTEQYVSMSIAIPRIIVAPSGDVRCGYRDFELDVSKVNLQPVAHDILIQHLKDNERHTLMSGDGAIHEGRLEDYLVRGLIDFNEINYEEHADLLYSLAGQMVRHLQNYLSGEDDVRNVLQYHQNTLVRLIHAQMQDHYEETATAYEVHVSKGFQDIRPENFTIPEGEAVRNFRAPVEERQSIRRMLFGEFSKCLYSVQKFDSDSERRFAVVIEDDADVLKWFKPQNDVFHIHYGRKEAKYKPDFVVETKDSLLICEPKMANEIDDPIVQEKARAAIAWCERASTISEKPWLYLLIPHSAIDQAQTLAGLITRFGCGGKVRRGTT